MTGTYSTLTRLRFKTLSLPTDHLSTFLSQRARQISLVNYTHAQESFSTPFQSVGG